MLVLVFGRGLESAVIIMAVKTEITWLLEKACFGKVTVAAGSSHTVDTKACNRLYSSVWEIISKK